METYLLFGKKEISSDKVLFLDPNRDFKHVSFVFGIVSRFGPMQVSAALLNSKYFGMIKNLIN
jgi:hypothetical protein